MAISVINTPDVTDHYQADADAPGDGAVAPDLLLDGHDGRVSKPIARNPAREVAPGAAMAADAVADRVGLT